MTILLLAVVAILLFGAAVVRSAIMAVFGAICFVIAMAYVGFQLEIDPMYLLIGFCVLMLSCGLAWRILDPAGFSKFEQLREEGKRKK